MRLSDKFQLFCHGGRFEEFGRASNGPSLVSALRHGIHCRLCYWTWTSAMDLEHRILQAVSKSWRSK